MTRRGGTTGTTRRAGFWGTTRGARVLAGAKRLRAQWVAAMTAPARKWRNWRARRIQDPVVATPWGFKSPLSHVFFPSFPHLSPRSRHNGLWVRHNFSPKERRVEQCEPLQLAPAIARHPLPVVAPEREVVDPRLG